MKKIILAILMCCAIVMSGCAKGEITLDVSRLGSADVTCKLVAVPILQPALDSFQKDFTEDGFDVTEAKDGEMSGFQAHKFYLKISDVKDSKVLEAFKFSGVKGNVAKGENVTVDKAPATEETKKPLVTFKEGLLFDTVSVNTHLDLVSKSQTGKDQEQWIMQNIMKQVELRFILKLPTKTDNNNATSVSEDGKTLTWELPLGEDTQMKATATFLNPYKAAAWVGGVVIIVIGVIFFMAWKRRNKAPESTAVMDNETKE